MTIKASWIVNTGQYQHVEVTIEGETVETFEYEMSRFSDQTKARLGLFQAELESWVIPARQNALEGVHQDGVYTVTSLGATVVETVQTETPAAVTRPWERKQEAAPKAWAPKKPAALDDF